MIAAIRLRVEVTFVMPSL